MPLSAENREEAKVKASQEVELTLELDAVLRVVEIPEDLKSALASKLAAFEALAPSKRKELVRQVNEAKAPETRKRRIEVIVTSLKV